MTCNNCGKELPEEGKFCPYCGAENAPEEMTEELPEEVLDEVSDELPEEATEQDTPREKPVRAKPEKSAKKKDRKKAKRAAGISGCIALMVVLALVLLIGFQGVGSVGGWWKPNDDIHEQDDYTTSDKKDDDTSSEKKDSYTVPNKKNGYTVSDKQAKKKADVVVATLGDAKLTNAELQIYYQLQIVEFFNDYYYYIYYMSDQLGLDYTKPLDEQDCTFREGYTWQQYFLEKALTTWRQNTILTMEAEQNDFALSEDMQEYLDKLEQSTAEIAVENGFTTADELLHAECGPNTGMSQYQNYMHAYYTGYMYFSHLYENIERLSDAELESYFTEHKDELKEEGIEQDGETSASVRHILIQVKTTDDKGDSSTLKGTENDDGSITFSDTDAAAAALAEAERILALWRENPTESYFGELANTYSEDQDGEVTDGGIYTGITSSTSFVTQFKNWCLDEKRAVGDCEIVETIYGYHIMYFSGTADVWRTETQDYYVGEEATRLLSEALEKYPYKVNYGKIALAYIPMGTK